MIFVTHDVEEAAFLADRVIIFSKRPARIVSDVDVAGVLGDVRSTAQRDSTAFFELRKHLLAKLRDLGIGDGGTANDAGNGHLPNGNAPDLGVIMGKMIRIDPNTRTLLVTGFPNVGKSSFMNSAPSPLPSTSQSTQTSHRMCLVGSIQSLPCLLPSDQLAHPGLCLWTRQLGRLGRGVSVE